MEFWAEISKNQDHYQKENEFSCIDICDTFYSTNGMISDDLIYIEELKSMYSLLSKIIKNTITESDYDTS